MIGIRFNVNDAAPREAFFRRWLFEALAALRAVNRFREKTAATPDATHAHPVVGPIGIGERARAQHTHAPHHLRQFGLRETEV